MIYHLVVAIPPNFDINYHLKLRELANIPDTDEIEFDVGDAATEPDFKYEMNVEFLRQIAISIATSTVTTLMSKKPEMFEKIAEIFNDLGLVLHYKKDYNAAVMTTRKSDRKDELDNHINRRFLFTCVNVLNIIDNKNWVEVLTNVVNLEDYYPPNEVIQEIRAVG